MGRETVRWVTDRAGGRDRGRDGPSAPGCAMMGAMDAIQDTGQVSEPRLDPRVDPTPDQDRLHPGPRDGHARAARRPRARRHGLGAPELLARRPGRPAPPQRHGPGGRGPGGAPDRAALRPPGPEDPARRRHPGAHARGRRAGDVHRPRGPAGARGRRTRAARRVRRVHRAAHGALPDRHRRRDAALPRAPARRRRRADDRELRGHDRPAKGRRSSRSSSTRRSTCSRCSGCRPSRPASSTCPARS